jgi:hypothetical protein
MVHSGAVGDPYRDPWAFLERVIPNTGAVQSSKEAAQIIMVLLNADEPLRAHSSAWATEFVGAKLADTDGSAAFKALDEYLRLGD